MVSTIIPVCHRRRKLSSV